VRALAPGRTNPRNCLEITLLFNGRDPALLRFCHDRPAVGLPLRDERLSAAAFPCKTRLSGGGG
jgi:hypothetical protein